MFNTATLSIIGNVVADPRISGESQQPDRVTFRVVSNRRRRDPQSGEWIDAGEYGVNVVCWRQLARGVAESIHRGDPVFVTGRMTSREYTAKDGSRQWMTELTADVVGHDMSRGVSGRFHRFTKLDRLDQDHADDASSTAPSEAVASGSDGFDTPAGVVFEADEEGSQANVASSPQPSFA